MHDLSVRSVLGFVKVLMLSVASAWAGTAVVTNGKFTNVYVYPDPDQETWEQHIQTLRPADAAQFSRANIDRFTADLMKDGWPSYFDPLQRYRSSIGGRSGIYPPQFFGSGVATQKCVNNVKGLRERKLVQLADIRALANCHESGLDPSPQVNLIFSPDIRFADVPSLLVAGSAPEICTSTNTTNAYHSGWINVPDFTVLPTSTACMPTFDTFTEALSHEVVETVSDPKGAGMGTLGKHELADNCENRPRSDAITPWDGYSVSRYWSNFDQNCQPRLDPPDGSAAVTWVVGAGSPLKRFTGDVHALNLNLPVSRVIGDAVVTQVMLVVQTGGDDLRGGSKADATLNFAGGSVTTTNINQSRAWENNETHTAVLSLPDPPPHVRDITGLTLSTHFGGGIGGDNWNVNKIALVVSFPSGSRVISPVLPTVRTWVDRSGIPLIRFTGSMHDLTEPIALSTVGNDKGKLVLALNVIISTGNDDLRGGSSTSDNCDLIMDLVSGQTLTVKNANRGQTWNGWTSHTVTIPFPPGSLKAGDIKDIRLHTQFGGGISGDNWNVNHLQLQATLGEIGLYPAGNF